MLDLKDFSIFENQSTFDFKGFLLKIAGYWKWFLISLAICFFIAYQVNIRKEKIYGLETLISVKEESPIATHLPFVIEERNDEIVLVAHLSKANEQWKTFAD